MSIPCSRGEVGESGRSGVPNQQHAAALAVMVGEHTSVSSSGLTGKSEPKRNITDPQSRTMPLCGGGWLQGCNSQAVTSSDELIIATAVGNNPSDAIAFTQMMGKAVAAAALIDAHRPATAAPDGIGGAGGRRRISQRRQSHCRRTGSVDRRGQAPRPRRRRPRAPHHRATTAGVHSGELALYKQRSHITETPFAHAKHNPGFRRITSRGIHRATAEFSFHALVHNLFKAFTAGTLTPAPR